jgi:hypothetical protein
MQFHIETALLDKAKRQTITHSSSRLISNKTTFKALTNLPRCSGIANKFPVDFLTTIRRCKFCAACVQKLTRYSHLFSEHKQMNPQIKLFSSLLTLKTTHCLTAFESQSNDNRLLSFSMPCCIRNRPHSNSKREISDTIVTRWKRR